LFHHFGTAGGEQVTLIKAKLNELSLLPLSGGEVEIKRRAAADLSYWSNFISKNNIRVE
jgi:hypothetical protein